LANFFRGGSTLLVGILLARILGPEDYGVLVFLIATSMVVKQFLDLGSSSAFFTFLSQEPRSVKFVAKFWAFFFGKYIISILIILLIFPGSWLTKIWLGNSSAMIVIALMAVAFQSDFWPIASQLLESQRKTIRAQTLFFLTQIIHFGFIFELHSLGILTIINYLVCIALLWLIAGIIAVISYEPAIPSKDRFDKQVSLSHYIKFCLPVAPVIALNFTSEFLDKWMLQNFGGADQQAFFAISAQIASISLLFTASFIKIFWKEVAEAMHKGDSQSAIELYTRARKLIFYCAALIATSFIPWTSQIVNFLYGPSYSLAAVSLVFLMLYSIYQSVGQIDGAFLMATGKTKVGFKMHFFLAPIGMFCTFFLLSKSDNYLFGLGLGATGLAIKMIISQVISGNMIAHLIRKEFSIKAISLNQIQILIFLSLLAWAIKIILFKISASGNYLFIFGILLNFVCVILLACWVPRIFSLPADWLKKVRLIFFS
jgi:O-antigen/teichoic acid export membrane protein